MLHEFIATHHDSIAARTTENLRTRQWPPSASELEGGGVPAFLTQLAETLRCGDDATPFSQTIGSTAARTGHHLLDLGFDVGQVVHVYGAVCQAITELALEQQTPIAVEEFHVLNRCLDSAIAEAATEHTRIAARQATNEIERLAQVTHGLRDSLNTAQATITGLVADRRHRAGELAQLRQLSGRLLRGDDGERRQMARELQENVAQILTALLTSLSLAHESDVNMDPHTRRIIGEGLSLLRRCCDDIMTMSYLLHPPLLTAFALEAAIGAYVSGFVLRTGIELSVDIPSSFGKLPPGCELALFRIMQEALRQVHQSGGKKAAVRLFRDARATGLEVTGEFGEGPLDAQPSEHSMPEAEIVGITERLRMLGGRLTVSCVEGKTTIRAALPLMPRKNPRLSANSMTAADSTRAACNRRT